MSLILSSFEALAQFSLRSLAIEVDDFWRDVADLATSWFEVQRKRWREKMISKRIAGRGWESSKTESCLRKDTDQITKSYEWSINHFGITFFLRQNLRRGRERLHWQSEQGSNTFEKGKDSHQRSTPELEKLMLKAALIQQDGQRSFGEREKQRA